MNYSVEPGRIAEVGIDREAAAHCLTLLSSLEGAADVQLWPADAGVWNNVVIKAVTPQQTYYFKQYREFVDIPNYSPPRIPTGQRAQVAQIAQAAATKSFIDGYRLVPAILALDDTAFVMEAVPEANNLLGYLSSARCPQAITTTLPAALARFHNAARSENYIDTPLSDNRFRDYKVDLQYHNVAQSLDPEKGQILRDFAEWYKQQQECITHGDLNSKNVLLTPGGTAHVIDFEQAHLGTPAYDLAFILSELCIAEIQHKQNPTFHNLSRIFTERYLGTLEGYDRSRVAKEASLHLAAQIIYRFTGPSHKVWTSYVSDEAREEALEKAIALITTEAPPVSSVL
jgi:aminoglycoside phosphotransferase